MGKIAATSVLSDSEGKAFAKMVVNERELYKDEATAVYACWIPSLEPMLAQDGESEIRKKWDDIKGSLDSLGIPYTETVR